MLVRTAAHSYHLYEDRSKPPKNAPLNILWGNMQIWHQFRTMVSAEQTYRLVFSMLFSPGRQENTGINALSLFLRYVNN